MEHRDQLIYKSRRGFVLLMSVFAIAFISIMVIGYLQFATTDLQIVRNGQYSTRALYIADAGLEDAVYQLRQNNLWSAGFTNKAFAGETYTVTVVNTYPTAVIDSISTVSATFQRHVQAQVTISGAVPYTIMVNSWKEI